VYRAHGSQGRQVVPFINNWPHPIVSAAHSSGSREKQPGCSYLNDQRLLPAYQGKEFRTKPHAACQTEKSRRDPVTLVKCHWLSPCHLHPIIHPEDDYPLYKSINTDNDDNG